MSCSSCNECGDYIDSCVENNDCYQNCGCVNPSTFECTTYTGENKPVSGIAYGMNGNEVIDKIEEVAAQYQNGNVKINADDTCPANLLDKLAQGANISFTVVGTGCEQKIRIDSTTGGVVPDQNVKVSANDTTAGSLNSKTVDGTFIKRTIVNPGANEQLKFDVVIDTLLSKDSGNQLVKGTDGKLKTSYTTPDGTDTQIRQGEGVTVTGTGSVDDPYVIATNPAIQAARTCFDGKWKDITLATLNNPNVTVVGGKAQFRIRFDGTIEFRGNLTFNVGFGTYSSTNRKFTLTIGSLPVTCLTAAEQAGISDLKNINYIDAPQASTDQYTQMYGYIIRKSAQNIIVEFQSSFINATSKTVVVDFNGAVSHPSI